MRWGAGKWCFGLLIEEFVAPMAQQYTYRLPCVPCLSLHAGDESPLLTLNYATELSCFHPGQGSLSKILPLTL